MSQEIKVIAEIANAHQGDPEIALAIARAAVDSGANSVKFQIYFSDELLTRSHPRYEHFKQQSFAPDVWDHLLSQVKSTGAEVYADVFGLRALDIALKNDIDGIKVHSSDLINTKLLDELAFVDKKVFLATGGSSLLEIRYALDHVEFHNKPEEIVLMHGFQAYPTRAEDSNLARLKVLSEMFSSNYLLGYMDHVDADDPYTYILPLLAIPYGVKYLEKHITFDRANKGVDYYSSLEPAEFRKFIDYVKLSAHAIGDDPNSFSEAERHYRTTVKKSWTLNRPLAAGEVLTSADLTMKRAPDSVSPPFLENLVDKRIIDSLPVESTVNKINTAHKVLAIIVVRTRSSRLPNKALSDICGEPTIVHLIKRLLCAKDRGYIDNIAVCTTKDESDNELAQLVSSYPVSVYRGEVKDVLSRMMLAVKDYSDHDVVLRVTGDDILIDPDYLNKTVQHHLKTNAHYTDAKQLPSGTEVEVFDSTILQTIYEISNDSSGTEYLTNYVIENLDQFNVSSLPVDEARRSDYRLTIDTPEDFAVVEALLTHFQENDIRYDYTVGDILDYMSTHQDVVSINQNVVQRAKPICVDAGLSWEDLTKNPLVTIYITNHNYANFIRQSIESVLDQRMRNFELIIIDDGSTDDSRKIIQEYSKNPKVKTVFQSNKGLNATNNIALNLARGKYIMRLDADDYLDGNALQLLSDSLENDSDLAMVFPDYYIVNQDGDMITHEYRHDFTKTVSLFDQPAHGACSMVRTDVLMEVGGYSEEFQCQDGYDLWVKIIGKYKVNNINLPLFYYRQHGSNLTSDEEKILKTRCDIIRKHTEEKASSPTNNLCIIPVRSEGHDSPLALRPFHDTTLLDLTVDQALAAENLREIIVTTDDPLVYAYASHVWKGKIQVDNRPPSLGALNVPIEKTVTYLVEKYFAGNDPPDTVTLLNYEYPLRDPKYIDKSIDVIYLYDADSSISVSKRSGNLYRHGGGGLEPFSSNGKLRLERDAVYEELGGLHSFRYESFVKEGQVLAGKVTHILLDYLSSKKIGAQLDFDIAQFLYDRSHDV